MTDLRKQKKYKWFRAEEYFHDLIEDRPWNVELQSSKARSRVYPYSKTELTVYTNNFGVNLKLKEMPLTRGWRDCGPVEWEYRFDWTQGNLDAVAKVVKLRKRTNYSEEYKNKLRAQLKRIGNPHGNDVLEG